MGVAAVGEKLDDTLSSLCIDNNYDRTAIAVTTHS